MKKIYSAPEVKSHNVSIQSSLMTVSNTEGSSTGLNFGAGTGSHNADVKEDNSLLWEEIW